MCLRELPKNVIFSFTILVMQESLVLWCLSKELFCKFLRPLTVLIPNCIYRCDIIHPLVRYHGRSRRSPAPPSGPLGGPSGRPNTRSTCDTPPQIATIQFIWVYMPFGEHTLFSLRKVFLVKTRFAVFCLAKRKAILV